MEGAYHAVVAGQGDAHEARVLGGPHRQDARLWRVDDGGEVLHPVRPVAQNEAATTETEGTVWRDTAKEFANISTG